MIKLPEIPPLSLHRVREIAEGSTPLMGEVQRLAVTALGYFDENKSSIEAFQDVGFTLLERERQLEVALAEVQRLNATAQPVSDWQREAERMAEQHGMSFVLFCNGEEPKCADPTKVRIVFTDKGLGYPAAPGGQ